MEDMLDQFLRNSRKFHTAVIMLYHLENVDNVRAIENMCDHQTTPCKYPQHS